MLEFPFDTTRTVTDLLFTGTLQRYPHIRWLFPHCGGTLPFLADRIELFRSTFLPDQHGPNTRDLLARLWYDLAGTPFPTQAPALADMVGASQLLYGSDYCFTPSAAVADQIAGLDHAPPPHPGPDWRTLTTRNADRLFAGTSPRR